MSGGGERTAVLYVVPEDGDDEAHPNFFSIMRAASKVRLGDVKKTFPLPGGYQFRFKKQFKNTFVWMDVLDDHDVVPKFEGQIFAKASRLKGSQQPRSNATSGAANWGAKNYSDAPPRVETLGTGHGGGTSQKSGSLLRELNTKHSSSDLLGRARPIIHRINRLHVVSEHSHGLLVL
jgi:hypothetical protein